MSAPARSKTCCAASTCASVTIPALPNVRPLSMAHRALVRFGERELSYEQVRVAAARAAGTLQAAGVAPGDRVGAMCENGLELLELILGCAWSGAIAVPINTARAEPSSSTC